jgi:hypothetical protein
MNYAGELRSNWKPLLAATLGLAMGMSLQGYINSIFAPQLVKEFGCVRDGQQRCCVVHSSRRSVD